MSIQLLNKLAGNSNGSFRKLIDNLNEKAAQKIAWYPSAGRDFRALLYLHPLYNKFNPASKEEPAPPDLFVFTDYHGDYNLKFLDKLFIFEDRYTKIKVESKEELPELKLRLRPELIGLSRSEATNRVVFLNISVSSNKLGSYNAPVIYACAENTEFFRSALLRTNSIISHVIHIRYGGGCGGGGTSSGIWLLKALKLLKTEIYITDNHHYWQSGDEFAISLCPELAEQTEPVFETIRTLSGGKWSNHGDVSWNLIL